MVGEGQDSRRRRVRRLPAAVAPAIALLVALIGPSAHRAAAAGRDALLGAARQVIAEDPVGALVTIDGDGAARIRSVEVRPPDDGDEDFVLWVATQPRTRKVAQIEAEPRVVLYFERDGDGAYLSISGRATLHRDVETARRISWRSAEAREQFWPAFPEDYVLIRIVPEWLEVIGFGIEADEQTWSPQRLEFGAADE